MSRVQRSVIALLAALACALVVLLGRSVLQLYTQWSGGALGAPLPTSPYTPLGLPSTWTPPPTAFVSAPATRIAGVTPVTPLCGGPAVMNLLLIGSDTRSGGYTWGLADVIRLARIDFMLPSLTVLDFPRDLWVEIPEIADDLNGQDHEKLNQAYLYGNPGDGFGYWDDPSAGPGLLARTLDLNYGAKVDHYLAVNMRTFVRAVDALGGIDVTLEHRVAGSHNPHLQAGRHHLDGAEALALARDRSEGVFSRGDNQNIVLCALRDALTRPAVIPKIPQLLESFEGSVQSDLDPKTLSQLACLAVRMPADNITLYAFPEDLLTGTRVYDPVLETSVFIWEADNLVMRSFVAQFQAGTWPETPASASPSGTASSCP